MAEYLAQPPEGRFVEAGPIKMHVLEYGNPENPAVVFVVVRGLGIAVMQISAKTHKTLLMQVFMSFFLTS